jgi:membrane protein implicated in regulation of membrane protease activity
VAGETLVGRIGRVVKAVRGGSLPGEVRVVVEGVPHYLLAYCAQPVPSGAAVLVINSRGSRRIDVEPWAHPGADEIVREERS